MRGSDEYGYNGDDWYPEEELDDYLPSYIPPITSALRYDDVYGGIGDIDSKEDISIEIRSRFKL